jgi:hypothetical protein
MHDRSQRMSHEIQNSHSSVHLTNRMSHLGALASNGVPLSIDPHATLQLDWLIRGIIKYVGLVPRRVETYEFSEAAKHHVDRPSGKKLRINSFSLHSYE